VGVAIRRHASAATLYVVGTSVRGRRNCLLRDPSAQHRPARSTSGIGSGAMTRCILDRILPSKWLLSAQSGNDLLTKQADRAHEIGLRQVREIEFTHKYVKQAGKRSRMNFLGDRIRRTDEDKLLLHQIICIEQVGHDLGSARLATADEFLSVL